MLYARNLSNAAPYDPNHPCVWHEAKKRGEAGNNDADDSYSPHRLLFPHIKALEEDQADIHLQNVLNAKLYSNREPMVFEWNSQIATSFRPLSANLENLVQSTADTMHARLSVNRPRAKVVTRGADFDVYRKGRQLDRFIWGEFQYQDVWSKAERGWIYDPMIYGTGFLKCDVDENTKSVFVERVHPDEIVVDQRECISNDMPMCMAQRKLVSRMWLLKTFGKDAAAKKAILEAQGKDWRYTSYRSPSDDQLVFVQAWKRETFPGAGDGREVMCIENFTFKDVTYKRSRFPFVWVKWRDPESGFYGLPMVSDIMGYQINQNEMNELHKAGTDLACVPRVFIEQGSDVQIHQIDNMVGKFIMYRGTMPECMTWNAFSPEFYLERDRNRTNAFRALGLSEQMAQSEAPTSQTRFDSSEALNQHHQHQDARLIKPAVKLEKAYLELAEHIIELTAELYKTKSVDRSTSYMSHNLVQQIPWSEVNLDRDRYVLQVAAASVLSMSPAQRTDKLENWLSEGKITLEQYYSMSGEPDLERLTDRLAAQSDRIETMVDRMLKGEPQTPTPVDNLDLFFNIVHDELMHVMSLDAPGEIVDIFMQALEIAQELMAPTPDPMAGMGGGAPGMPGMPQPAMPPGDPAMMPPPGMPGQAPAPMMQMPPSAPPVAPPAQF